MKFQPDKKKMPVVPRYYKDELLDDPMLQKEYEVEYSPLVIDVILCLVLTGAVFASYTYGIFSIWVALGAPAVFVVIVVIRHAMRIKYARKKMRAFQAAKGRKQGVENRTA